MPSGTLHFDAQGHLVPYELIETDWNSFENVFGWNEHRRDLIDALRSFISTLNKLPILTITLWIDGSFVTKKEHPNDLDAVVIIPAFNHHRFEHQMQTLRAQYPHLDLYFVRLIEPGERNYFLYLSDRTQWFFQFTTTKPSRVTRTKFPKGFVQITWHDESIS